MKRSHIAFYLMIALAAFPAFSGAQVMEEGARRTRLDQVAAVVDHDSGAMDAALTDLEDPFFSSRVALTGAKASGVTAAAGSDAQQGDLSPEGVLDGAAKLLGPTGLMMAGNRRFIVSSMGELYEVGKPVHVALADGPHDIVIESADNETFVLRLGAITITRKFVDNSGSAAGK